MTHCHGLAYPRIRSRLRLSDGEVDLILAALLSQAEMVGGDLRLPGAGRDPKDDPLVACAVEGAADYLVSGDGDLLGLGKHENTRRVSPREFVEILGL
ncbi:MAG: putative toxin-antitoxin system toxin component, PIN family [Anaerolineae bacterium]